MSCLQIVVLGKSGKQEFKYQKFSRIRLLCESAVGNVRFEARKRSNQTKVRGAKLNV